MDKVVKEARKTLENTSGLFGGRVGAWHGIKSIFTHRNPDNGKVWGEDIPVGLEVGMWVPSEEVEWL